MANFRTQEILDVAGGRLICGEMDTEATDVSTDTRKMKGGELFIAIKGPNFDGHNFVPDAISKGAKIILVQQNYRPAQASGSVCLIAVPDTVKALGDIAGFHRRRFNIPVIGITGSNGKTTTKEMIAALLSKRFNVLKNFGTENNCIGVPLTLLRLSPEHSLCVLEMGTNRLGEIERLSEIARPTSAVITNIGPSHLEFLNDLETVFRAKCELLAYLEKGSTVVINGDDENLKELKNGGFKFIRFGIQEGSLDFFAKGIGINASGMRFLLNGKWEIILNTLGRHNVYNALCSIAACWDFKIEIDEMREVLLNFHPPSMRMEVKELRGIKLINDSYNSNPLSMRQAIEALKELPGTGRKILIAGDMLELGNHSSRFHHLLGRQAAEMGIDFIIAVGRLSSHVIEGALKAGMDQNNCIACPAIKEVLDNVLKLIRSGDTVLVKGSRAMRMETIVEELEGQLVK